MNDIEERFNSCNLHPLIIQSPLLYFSNLFKLQASCYVRLYKILFIHQQCIRIERKNYCVLAVT